MLSLDELRKDLNPLSPYKFEYKTNKTPVDINILFFITNAIAYKNCILQTKITHVQRY